MGLPGRPTFNPVFTWHSRLSPMRETDNQPEIVAVRYAAAVNAALLIGGELLMVVGEGFIGSLVFQGGLALAALTCVSYMVLKFLAVLSANTLLGFLGAQSGSSTLLINGHSAIEALVAQWCYQDAAVTYRQEIAANPSGIEARFRLAQLLIDCLEDFTATARYLKEAREVTTNDRQKMGYSLRLVDLYRNRLEDRGKATMELRRFIDTFPNSRHIDTVRRELSELLVEIKAEPEAD